MTDAEMLAGPMTRLAMLVDGDGTVDSDGPLLYAIGGPWGTEFLFIPYPPAKSVPLVMIKPLSTRKN